MSKDNVYAALKAFGFSPTKALEVKIDAARGGHHAAQFVGLALSKFKGEA